MNANLPVSMVDVQAALCDKINFSGEGDVVLVLSGRNVDIDAFDRHIQGGHRD